MESAGKSLGIPLQEFYVKYLQNCMVGWPVFFLVLFDISYTLILSQIRNKLFSFLAFHFLTKKVQLVDNFIRP